MSTNTRGRPRKEDALRREFTVTVRLTEQEFKALRRYALRRHDTSGRIIAQWTGERIAEVILPALQAQ